MSQRKAVQQLFEEFKDEDGNLDLQNFFEKTESVRTQTRTASHLESLKKAPNKIDEFRFHQAYDSGVDSLKDQQSFELLYHNFLQPNASQVKVSDFVNAVIQIDPVLTEDSIRGNFISGPQSK